jgi:hypothetical protein
VEAVPHVNAQDISARRQNCTSKSSTRPDCTSCRLHTFVFKLPHHKVSTATTTTACSRVFLTCKFLRHSGQATPSCHVELLYQTDLLGPTAMGL